MTYANPSTTDGHGHIEGYSFTLANGQITAMQEVEGSAHHTETQSLPLSPAAVFTVSDTTVTDTTIQGNAVESITFTQPAGSTLYAVASQTATFVQAGTAGTQLWVDPYERATFTIDSSGAVTQMQQVSPTGTTATVRPDSHITFQQLEPGFVQETVTAGHHSGYAVFYDGSGTGTYTEVAHGSGTTVDLVGLQAQIAQLPTDMAVLI